MSLTLARLVEAQGAEPSGVNEMEPASHQSVAFDVPRVAYTDTALGAGAHTLGAAGFGELRGGASASASPHAGGGVRIWGSPLDRLLFTLDAQRRDQNDRFAPSLSAEIRILGGELDGWALGLCARYKAEGFAELGGELESGVLFGVNQRRFHLDLNAVAGGDFDGGESDGELLARSGYDVLPFLRLGVEGRGRNRLTGKAELPGGRTWDAFAGAQLFAFADRYFVAATGGPSTVGISDGMGWSVIASAGGVMF